MGITDLINKPERADDQHSDSPPIRANWKVEGIYFAVFAAITLALTWKFLFTTGDIISHGDANAFFGEGHRFHDLSRYLFNDFGSLSNLENFNTTLFVFPIIWVLEQLGGGNHVNYYKVSILTFLVVSYASITVFLHWFFSTRSTLRSSSLRAAQFLGAILFVFSPYMLNVYVAGGFWLAYGLTPIFLVCVYKVTEERFSARVVVALAVVIGFMAMGTQFLFYGLFIGGVIAVIEILATLRTSGDRARYLRSLAVRAAMLGVLCFALNASWLLPSLDIYRNGSAISPGYVVDRSMIAFLGDKANVFTTALSADSWVQVNDHIHTWLRTYSPAAIFFRCVLVVAAMTGALILGKGLHRRTFLTLMGLFLLFWSFSIGLRNPVYGWLALDSPLQAIGWMFRAPSKLTYFLWIFYAIGFSLCAERIVRSISRRPAQIAASAAIVALVFVPSFNKLNSAFTFYMVPTDLPAEYHQMYSFLDEQDQDGATKAMFVAPFQYGFDKNAAGFEASFTWEPEKMAGGIVEQSSPVPSVGYWHYTYRNWQESLYAQVYPEFTGVDPNSSIPKDVGRRYLGPANVRYLVFHNDIVGAEQQGRASVDAFKNTDLKLVRQFGESMYVFENPFVQPLVTVPNESGLSVTTDKINPARYDITVPPSIDGRTIDFAQAYDPLWVLRSGNTTIKSERTASGLTQFTLPASLSRSTATIEYLPQNSYKAGQILAFLTLAASIGFLAVTAVLRRRKNAAQPRMPAEIDLTDARREPALDAGMVKP